MEITGYFRKRWIIFAVVILLVAAIYLGYDLLLFNGQDASFAIQDKCGLFYNLFSHTINDENDCRIKCTYQCDAQGFAFRSSEFSVGVQACNNCTCHCSK